MRNLQKFWLSISIAAILATALGLGIPFESVNASPLQSVGFTGSYIQNFDTLASSGTSNTWANDSTLTGWHLFRQPAPGTAITTYNADTGGSNTGNFMSYGASGSTDRALGGLGSGGAYFGTPANGAVAGWIAFSATNNSGSTINELIVSFDGEQWRNGGNSTAQTMVLEYGFGTSFTTVSSWSAPGGNFNWTSPVATTTAAAVVGNSAGLVSGRGGTLSGLNWASGDTLWIRWIENNDAGNDHGLAIDNFTMSKPLPRVNLSVDTNNTSEAAATTVTVTATASSAVSGDQTVNLAASGTGITADDYTLSNSIIMIPGGSTTGLVTFAIVNDSLYEGLETATLTISNPSSGIMLGTTTSQNVDILDDDPFLPHISINDVTVTEGNSGTSPARFTILLDAPALTGDVTFDINVTDGTAEIADNDYILPSVTTLSIPATQSSTTFDVQVVGDTRAEANETFNVVISNPVGGVILDSNGMGTITNDDAFRIHDVQGKKAASPVVGYSVTLEGVVIGDYQGSSQLNGFFLQEENADIDIDPNTSEGIFVYCNTCPTAVAEGQRVQVTGTVSEFHDMTGITASTSGSVIVTGTGNHLAEVTPAPIDLPIVGNINAFYEAREGMLVTFVDTLTVSEYYELFRYGQIELFEGGRPHQFTELNDPDVAGYTAHLDDLDRRRVILDDDNDTPNAPLALSDGMQFVYHPHANDGFSVGTQATDFFRGGDLVSGLTGVLDWSFAGTGSVDAWRVRPTATVPAAFTLANPRPIAPPVVGGSIKAAGMNLLNYFTTIDISASSSSGDCGPLKTLDCRGADSVAELNRQRERASTAICTLDADVYALMELENTTAMDTIDDLLGAVNTRCGGTRPYAFVNTGGTLGADAIRVALIYRTGVLSPVGAPLVDLDPVHSRPPTAQTFEVIDATNISFGGRFTVIANHLKSKGCPGTGADADANDGQGCFNDKRKQQANRLLTWITGTVIPAAGDPDVLLLGDFNSYAKEDPVTILTGGGYKDLASDRLGTSSYSYLFDSQLGHLDYAFANAHLDSQITGIGNWHINADESDLFDYNDDVLDSPGEASYEEKPNGSALVPSRTLYQPNSPYRASDHDPVLVGLTLTYTISGNAGVGGATITYAGGSTVTDPVTGNYSFTVPHGWAGTITATRAGYSFTPAPLVISAPVTADLPGQNFVAHPGTFRKSAPFNDINGTSVSFNISWGASNGATLYEYCLTTTPTTTGDVCDTTWQDNGTKTLKQLSGLTYATTYYWQARSLYNVGYTYANGGNWWKFSTASAPFKKTGLANNTTEATVNPTLTWTASSGATSYQYCLTKISTSSGSICDTGWQDNLTAQNVALSGLDGGTPYYWQVRALYNGHPVYANHGTWWSFTTYVSLPTDFDRTLPLDGSVAPSINPTISWAASAETTSYEYCLTNTLTTSGTDCDTGWKSNGTATSKALNLSGNATYYWQVRANNGGGSTYANAGNWGSFITPSGAFRKSAPFNGVNGTSVHFNISWSASNGAARYEYCITTIVTTSGIDCDTGWQNNDAGITRLLNSLTRGTTYYWQVRSEYATGLFTYANGGTWWSFTTKP